MVQVQGAREDLLIAGHHPLGWEDGEFPRGALLVVLALFPRLEDGEEDLQGSGDHLELLGHPHRMDQTSQQPVRYSSDLLEFGDLKSKILCREITTWQKSSPCLLRLPRRLRVRHSCQDIFQDQMSKLSSPGLDMWPCQQLFRLGLSMQGFSDSALSGIIATQYQHIMKSAVLWKRPLEYWSGELTNTCKRITELLIVNWWSVKSGKLY